MVITNTVSAQLPADSIKAIINQEVANKRSKSIIVGIIDANGRRIYSEGMISDENPVPPDANTIYEIGSITKVFTSLVLADMSLKHQLDLDDPISKFLPKTVKTPTCSGKEISLRTLSTHRSGFSRNAYNLDPKNLDNPFTDYTVDQLYEYVSNFELTRDIDSKWGYSNIAYTLLGHILTIVADKELETLVAEDICKPLNLKSTVFSVPRSLRKNLAQGHTEYGEPTHAWDLLPLAGGGGQRSTVNDLLTFAAANLGFIETPLRPAMELTHVQQAKKDGNYGYVTLGWTLWNDDGKQILMKDGGTGGYRTFLGIDKKNKFGVVVLSNSNNLVTDIGQHILDSTAKVKPYKYPWKLLDTLRITIKTSGIAVAVERYQQLKAANDPQLIFNEAQLNYLGNELRRSKKIKDAIAIYELNAKEYPRSTLVYESLAEIYQRNKDKKKAVEYFEKAHDLDLENPHWTYMINKLKG
jgi:D-alanyl-D-alanine-carboxypeptidase/D-alanyl-D-alanine-endopeptidase